MKKFLFIAMVVVSGLVAGAAKSHASAGVVAPSCPGHGQECGTGGGVTYVKCPTC